MDRVNLSLSPENIVTIALIAAILFGLFSLLGQGYMRYIGAA